MTRFLIDNSVIQRIPLRTEVAQAVATLLSGDHELCVSDVAILEAGFSARSLSDHRSTREHALAAFTRLGLSPEVGETAAELQEKLFSVGHGRAVGVIDLLHAATAVFHQAVVVHYDKDFALLADVDDRLRQQWVVPAGSVD